MKLAAAPDPQPEGPQRPRLLTARKFLAEFQPLESLIDGLPALRGGVVAITGPTGHGKTTLAALMEVCIRTGRRFAGRDVTAGSVLVCAGENPDDYAMHLIATLQNQGVDPGQLSDLGSNSHLMVAPGSFDLLAQADWLDSELGHHCGESLAAIFVDTSAAFFMGEEENDNVAMRRHASVLRELTKLPGRPTVFVLCHPTKNASRDNCLPRGGGAFLAEIDANLTVWKDEAGIVTLHWAGKIRGAPFDPIRFELVPVQLDMVDSRGRPIYSVAASHVSDDRAEHLQERELDDEDRLLVAMEKNPGASIRELAHACGWVSSADGKPLSTRVDRRMKALRLRKLVDQDRRDRWRLTKDGVAEALKVR